MTASFGPCSAWSPHWICDVSAESPTATGRAAMMATEVLWALSGRRFGTCEVTLRPCRRECYDTPWWSTFGPPWSSTSYVGFAEYPWFQMSCGGCQGSCSCAEVSEVILPNPVSSVTQVKIDGVPVTGIYRMDNNRLLVRTDGQRWPRCNDLSKNDSQPGTWSVTALYGEEVPTSGQLAVGELACEIIKATNGLDCRLPPGVKELARQGVTISIPDFGDLIKDGRTGLYLVDMFLFSVNPSQLATRSRTYSPDRVAHRRPS